MIATMPHTAGHVNQPFEFRQLLYFVTVAELGQITRAAAKLHLVQPALSQAIAKLEQSAGVPLLERHTRGVSLTPAGEAFYEKARAAVSAFEEAAAVVGPHARAERELVVGFTPSLYPIARDMIGAFNAANPHRRMRVRSLDSSERYLRLTSGEIDAEFVLRPRGRADIALDTVAESPRYVVLSDEHRLAGERELAFEQIAGERFPGLHESVSRRWAEDAWLSDVRGCDPPVTQEKPGSVPELWALIASGTAIAVLPHFMALATVGAGVRAIPLTDVAPMPVAVARRCGDRREILDDFVTALRAPAEFRLSDLRAQPSPL